MSPQIGLPHDCFACKINPTWVVTSLNCWATEIEERAVTNPIMLARHKMEFLTGAIAFMRGTGFLIDVSLYLVICV